MAPARRSIAVLVALLLATGAATQWWQGRSQTRLGERLAGLAQPGDIHMLSSLTCTYCTAARLWLTEHRVHFDECFIERDTQCQTVYAATGARGTPTLLVRGQVQLGFDGERVLAALEARP